MDWVAFVLFAFDTFIYNAFGDIHISTVPQCRNQIIELSEATDPQE